MKRRHVTLIDALERCAGSVGDRAAYTFLPDDDAPPPTLTYSTLLERVRATAAHLQGRGLVRGDRAILIYPPGLEFVCGFLGCVVAGIVPVAVHPPRDARSVRRMGQILADCGAVAILTAGELTEPIRTQVPALFGDQIGVIETDRIATGEAGGYRPVSIVPGDLAFLQYTSGSTAFPKGVMVHHDQLAANLEMICESQELSSSDTYLSWLPVFHDMGLIGGTFSPVWVGMSCIQMSPISFLKDPLRWLRMISEHRATVSGAPNFAFELCIRKLGKSDEPRLQLGSLRLLYNGAEPIRLSTLRRFTEVFAPFGFRSEAFFPCYGMAETTLIVSGGPGPHAPVALSLDPEALEQSRVAIVADGTGRDVVSCGRPVRETTVRIVDPESGEPAEPDHVGEIWVASTSVASGFWNKPADTEETFGQSLGGELGFLRTGDLGFLHDGRLYVTGRCKDLIILRGRNYYPQDIEITVQESHPALRPGCVAAFAVDTADSEGLVIVQEIARDAAGADPEELLTTIRRAVADAHQLVPHAIVVVKQGEVLKTSSGKIQRRATRDAYLAGHLAVVAAWSQDRSPAARGDTQVVKTGPTSAPEVERERRAIEEALLDWLALRLEKKRSDVPRDKHFSELGLDSLGVAEMIAALEERERVRITDQAAWGHPTVVQLGAYVAELRTRSAATAASAEAIAPGPSRFGVLEGNLASFVFLRGRDLLTRVEPFHAWQKARREAGLWPYSKVIHGVPAPTAEIGNDDGAVQTSINLGSIDYLGLSRHPAVLEAAAAAIRSHGAHSTSSAILQGNSPISLQLEEQLSELFGGAATLLFPTGWAAGFGSITAFVRPDDHVVMDLLGHACLQTGARAATGRITHHQHLDVEHAARILGKIRSQDARNGILVVTEGLYSMDSDWPDIVRLQEVCHEHDARLLIDVAHDIGSFGPQGSGQVGVQGMIGKVDLVMGAFSKSLAVNGGFLVTPSRAAREYAKISAGSHMFSSGLSPLAGAMALAALRISRSVEGDELRARLMRNVATLRAALRSRGLSCIGEPSPIVPVLVGSEGVGRIAGHLIAERGVNASLIEYPAVPAGAARLRMQLTPDHTEEQLRRAASVIADALLEARTAFDTGRLPWQP